MNSTNPVSSKIITLEDFLTIKKEKLAGKKIVFTNGCFDILHRGHIEYLYKAKNLGDVLVIGLNSDPSIKRLKGDKRPINQEMDRAMVLAAIEFVDFVIIFNEDTPYNLIKKIVPDILIKGGDWTETEIVGYDVVKRHGGKVISSIFLQNYSTTNIIKKIVSKYCR